MNRVHDLVECVSLNNRENIKPPRVLCLYVLCMSMSVSVGDRCWYHMKLKIFKSQQICSTHPAKVI